jgi:hypothetical protein
MVATSPKTSHPKTNQEVLNLKDIFFLEVIKEDDGFFSNLFVKWKSNPVFGKK